MSYEKITTKILGEHTEREGEVASLVLDFVAKNPDWEKDNESTLYEDKMIKVIDLVICQLYHLYPAQDSPYCEPRPLHGCLERQDRKGQGADGEAV